MTTECFVKSTPDTIDIKKDEEELFILIEKDNKIIKMKESEFWKRRENMLENKKIIKHKFVYRGDNNADK